MRSFCWRRNCKQTDFLLDHNYCRTLVQNPQHLMFWFKITKIHSRAYDVMCEIDLNCYNFWTSGFLLQMELKMKWNWVGKVERGRDGRKTTPSHHPWKLSRKVSVRTMLSPSLCLLFARKMVLRWSEITLAYLAYLNVTRRIVASFCEFENCLSLTKLLTKKCSQIA